MFVPYGSSASGVDVGDIGHSLRFAASRSCYMSRTITTDATSTYFAAIRRGKLGAITPIFDTNIKFNANDTLTAFGLTTTAVFRDPTSWLFIHVSNGGLYVNGVSYGAVTTSSITNPRIGYDGTNYADMYVARIGVVGGSSSAYTNFGYLNTDINEWVSKSQSAVKAVVDAGGTNSFMLDFDDGSSTTTLGYDKSSKGNNWTLSGHSLTTGTNYDWMLDVPGNSYATLNAVQKKSGDTLSNGNLTQSIASTTSAAPCATPATIFLNSGKWYAECTATTLPSTGFGGIGLIRATGLGTAASFPGNSGSTGLSWAIDNGGNTYAYENGSSTSKGAGSLSAGNVMQVAVDFDNQKFWIGINNSWLNSGNPSAGTSPFSTAITAGEFYAFALSTWNGGSWVFDWNFGQRPFSYTPPTGFKAPCQANLSDGGTVTVSGSFTGNLNADGPCVWMNGVPKTLSINGNAVTFGTHADKLATGFKVRTASSSYNNSGSNTFTATIDSDLQNIFKYNTAEGNP